MDIIDWLNKISGDETYSRIAAKAGLNAGTFSRQYESQKIPPASLVAIARAYRVSPLRAFVVSGLITMEEANVDSTEFITPQEALRLTSDVELIEELLRRIQGGGELAHPELFTPLDENHPAMQSFEPDVMDASELDLSDLDYAAKKAPYDIDKEIEADQTP